MGSTFNSQILVEKLEKLNSSQQSIETLSHWCIFHMNKAKQVVETWARQFRCSPRDQRLAYLYLANDILQNSRRKGSEFVGEFWKVLPDALRDVIDNTDESGRNAALRLVNIWEERKVFGSRGQILKEELVGRHLKTRNEKHSGLKLQQSGGNMLDKIVAGYRIVYGGPFDVDAMISKCKNAISCIEKVEKETGDDIISAQANGLGIMEELKGHHATLRDCINQLSAVESSRINLVCYLREALQDQEMKLDQVRSELKAAHSQLEKTGSLFRQPLNPGGTKLPPEQETNTPKLHRYVPAPATGEQSAPVMYTRQVPISDQSLENTKSAAAAMAAKLTASTSSAEMLSYVLSSLASEGVIGNSVKDSSTNDYPPEKRPKIDTQIPQPPPPPPPSSPPPLPPMPPMQAYPVPPFMQTAGTVPYGYSSNHRQPTPPLPGYPTIGPPMNGGSSYTPAAPPPHVYQNHQMEGGLMAPMSRK